MLFYRILRMLCLLLLIATSCKHTNPQNPRVVIAPNGTTTQYFYSGRLPGGAELLCEQKAEITPFLKTAGEIAVYTYATARGEWESRYQKIREAAPRQQEFEAAWFHVCQNFGSQAIQYEQYQLYTRDIHEFEQRWLNRDMGEAPMLTYLSKDSLVQGSEKNIWGGLSFDKPYWQEEICIAGRRYPHGIGLHPPENGVASVAFKIPQGARFFRTVLGFAEQRIREAPCGGSAPCNGDANVRILIDGQLIRSYRLRGHDGPPYDLESQEPVPIPPRSKILRLESDSAGPNRCDQVFWAEARFTD